MPSEDCAKAVEKNVKMCIPNLCSFDLNSPPQVHLLRSVDNLFVVVAEFDHYEFKESKVT